MDGALYEYLDRYLFNPRSIAVVGASNTPGKWGFGIINRVVDTRDSRAIYAINNKTPEVAGLKAYKSVRDVPDEVEFAVIAIPFQDVPQVMEDCVARGVRAALVISAGMGESGEEGVEVEHRVLDIARRGNIRFVGPNCMGHFNTAANFYTTGFVEPMKPGYIGIAAQSGGFTGHILHCGVQAGIGFSKVISTGNEANLHLEDYIEYFAQDEQTKVIGAYVEGFREGKRFLKLAREVTRKKPLIIMKVGRTEPGAKAAKGHTGALAGSDVVSGAALKQAGVVRVDDIEELFDTAAALLRQPLPQGRRIGILTGGGGHGVITTDACARLGLELAQLSPRTLSRLDEVLPPRWPHQNPVDTVAAGFVTYDCLGPIMEDENVDAVVAVGAVGMSAWWRRRGDLPLSMPSHIRQEADKMMDFVEVAEQQQIETALARMDKTGKPLIVIGMMMDPEIMQAAVIQKLTQNGITVYPTPERAAKALSNLCWYSEYLRQTA